MKYITVEQAKRDYQKKLAEMKQKSFLAGLALGVVLTLIVIGNIILMLTLGR
jgi:hypothetical protein